MSYGDRNMSYDERHGGPYDRGRADYWYHRPWQPHYFTGGSYTSGLVVQRDMTTQEIEAYSAGYQKAAENGEQKDWG